MSLVLNITNGGNTSDFLSFVINDSTGNYDATNNPTGYGSPNATRVSLALFVRAYNKRYNGSTDLTDILLVDTPNTSDPTAVTKWTIALNKDGWQHVTIYGLRRYDTAVLFSVNEIVYDYVSGELRQILTITGGGPYTYTYAVVTKAAFEVAGNTTAYSTVLDTYSIPSLENCHYEASKNYFNVLTEDAWDKYQEIEATLKSIIYGFAYLNFAQAQLQVETLEGTCTCFTSTCNC